MRHDVILVLSVIALMMAAASCSRAPQEDFDYMSLTDSLSCRTVRLSEEALVPTKLVDAGDALVLYQRKGERPFMIYPKPLDGNGYPAGFYGRGPEDFLGIDVQSLRACPGGFELADISGNIKTIRIMPDRSLEVSLKEQVKVGDSPVNGMMAVDGGHVAVNMSAERKEFMLCGEGEPRLVGDKIYNFITV